MNAVAVQPDWLPFVEQCEAQNGCLTVGFDEHNRRVMRLSNGALAVIYHNVVRGQRLPRPIPVEVAGVVTIR